MTRMVNGWIIPSNAARAVVRFQPDEPTGYQSSDGGPIRATREEAVQDWMRARGVIA